jgi:hypothetical protein
LSILSDLIEGKITFSTAASDIVQWAEKLISNDPAVTNAAASLVTDAKQAASDAITIGESALGPVILPASKALETALETALASATKGLSVGFNPLISSGIDTIANALQSQIATWALEAKASLATAPVANTAVQS